MTPPVDGYDSLELIGSGGCATVWRARRIADGVRVAIKIPRGEHATADFIERFDEECDLLRRVRPHPNVVPVLGRTRAQLAEGPWVPALVMEEIADARTLVAFADEAKLDVRGRLRLFRSVCAGVAHLHRAGVVHLDLKPSNVLVDATGTARVADLGAAKILLNNDARRPFFTPQFASPEQLAGAPEALEQSSDIYSLGKILATLLGGEDVVSLPRSMAPESKRNAVGGREASDPNRSVDEEPRYQAAIEWSPERLLDVVDDLDPEIHRIIVKATQRRPADRYADARELLSAIDERLRPWPLRVLHHAAAALRATPRGARRAGVRASVATAAVGLAIAASFGGAWVLLQRSMQHGGATPTMLAPAPTSLEGVLLVEIPPACDLAALARLTNSPPVDPRDLGTFRPIHAALVERLARGGARAIGIDVRFPQRPDLVEGTQRLADAIVRAAAEQHCPVVVALCRLDAWPPESELDPQLRAVVAGWGSFELFDRTAVGQCVPIAAQLGDQEPALGFAAAVLKAAQRQGAATLEPDDGTVAFRGVGADSTRIDASLIERLGSLPLQSHASLSPQAMVAAHSFNFPPRAALAGATIEVLDLLALEEAGLRSRVAGRIVLVTNNLGRGDEDPARPLDGQPLLKAWNHASAIAMWLQPPAPTSSSARVLPSMAGAALLGVIASLPAIRALNRRLRARAASGRGGSPRVVGLLATAAISVAALTSTWVLVALCGVTSFEALSILLAGFFGVVMVFAIGAGGRPVPV